MVEEPRSNEKSENSRLESTATLDVADFDETYNPFEHRCLDHPTSTLGSFVNLLKSSLGSGLLAMPAAFKHAGIIPGSIGLVLVACIATHCVNILVQTSRDLCKECRRASLNYTDTCVEAFKRGPKKLKAYKDFVRHFADYTMAGVCGGGTSVYVLFIASSLKNICDYLLPEYKISLEGYCGILLLPLILLTQLRHLKFLVPFSMLANVCLLATVLITCYYTFITPDFSKVNLVSDVKQWPLFISTAIFSMEGINVVMPVENEMAKPQYFLGCPGVLSMTMTLVCCLYGIVGLFGYLRFGDAVLGSITLNLPETESCFGGGCT